MRLEFNITSLSCSGPIIGPKCDGPNNQNVQDTPRAPETHHATAMSGIVMQIDALCNNKNVAQHVGHEKPSVLEDGSPSAKYVSVVQEVPSGDGSDRGGHQGDTPPTFTISNCVSNMSNSTAVYHAPQPPTAASESNAMSQRVYNVVTAHGKQQTSPTLHIKTLNNNNNGQQRLQTVTTLSSVQRSVPAQKVQILSNVVMHKNMALNKGAPLQVQRQVLGGKLANSAKALMGKGPPKGPNMLVGAQPKPLLGGQKGSLKTNVVSRTAPLGKNVKTLPPAPSPQPYAHKPGIKTLSPQYNHYGKLQTPVKVAPGQTGSPRVGIKTLAPQKPPAARNHLTQKPNYIGKHALGLQKAQKSLPVATKGRGVATRPPAGRSSPTKYVAKNPNSQSSFNQSLTAQILQSLPKSGGVRTADIGYTSLKNYSLQSPTDSTLSDEIGEEVRPEISSNLSYLSQVVMLDHNYGAPPPAVSPPTARPPQQSSNAMNGLPSNSVMSQGYHNYGAGAIGKRNRHNSLSNIPPSVTSTLPQMVESQAPQDDDAGSTISSETGREVEPEGEETETAPEGEGDEDGITRCICDFDHDDGYMICCDICSSWQHVDCMGLDREHIPEKYACVRCEPRRVDRQQARLIQQRKREELAASDSSSDTSTASSVEQHPVSLNNNLVGKKRVGGGVPIPLQTRRKSEPVHQRRVPINTVQKRQLRRESMRESSVGRRSALKKREKKTVMKRKMKSRSSIDDDSQDSWPTPTTSSANNVGASLQQLRQWIENYEEAVTNHYSPELRARISNMRANGSHASSGNNALPSMAQADVAVQKCRLITQPMTSIKIVMSTMNLPPNTAVIELRGKYMLSTQHRSVSSGPASGGLLTRQHSQRPGPFLFFYRLPRDNTEVCVDTRTYGNDARFIRRSCKPNAELRHCLEKGTLHLYVVTVTTVDKNTELTIKHESHDLAAAATTNVACACGNPSQCGLFGNQRKNGGTSDTPDVNNLQRKRRGRRISEPSQEPISPVPEPLVSPVAPVPPPPPPPPPPAVVTRRTSHTRTEPHYQPPVEKPEPVVLTTPSPETKDKKKKLTREERKMEAIMKAFERLEKAEQRKQEVQARQAQRRESEPSPASSNRHHENGDSDSKPRRKKKGRARTISTNSQSGRRRTRLNSTDSYITSGDEGSLLSPPLPASSVGLEAESKSTRETESPLKSPPLSQTSDISSPAQVTTAAGLLLALANGAHGNPEQTMNKSPPRETDGNSSSSSIQSSPSTPLSSACLLVAAAVGPLEPGFKFPKTKKAIMNEWLNKSPEPVQPASSISPMSLQPHMGQSPVEHQQPLAGQHAEFYSNKSLATLVQAASLCDSPPQAGRHISNQRSQVHTQGQGQGGGNAKKRWLRQAISEECDSPCSRPESPPCAEMVAPPKKRRLARESLSSEQSFTPPTTPTMLVPPSNPLTEEDYPNNDEEFYTPEEHRSTEGSPNGAEFPKSHLALGSESDKICKDPNRVEIVYGNHDAEGLSPVQPELEPDAVLKERVVEMQLEFGGNVKQTTELLDNITTLRTPTENFAPACVPSVPEFTNSLLGSTHGILDPRLGRDRPMFRDSAQLLGTVEKTIKFYEENFTSNEEKEKPTEIITPAKRKLSISEYRQRKQLNNDRCNEETSSPGSPRTTRACSSSSSTSSPLSSDDEAPAQVINTEPQNRGTVAFNSEPTTVERQRENVERLKKAFGLALDEDARKNNLNRDLNSSPKSAVSSPSASCLQPSPKPDVALDKNPTADLEYSKTPMHDEETESQEMSSFSDSVSTNYIPPFNNPVYPNSTQFTSFSTVVDPYEGRNPSPPPSDVLAGRLASYGGSTPVKSPNAGYK